MKKEKYSHTHSTSNRLENALEIKKKAQQAICFGFGKTKK